MAVPNQDWTDGYFKQACFDLLQGTALRASADFPYGKALSLAQFQQASEKAMKAAVLHEAKQRVADDDELILKHDIWAKRIERDEHLRGLRNKLLNAVEPNDRSAILELEGYAPQADAIRPNTEYPWRERDEVLVPSEHFHAQAAVVDRMELVARAIVFRVRDSYPRFNKVWEVVKQSLSLTE